MQILHLDFDDLESPLAGGQAVRTFEINRRLVKKGHRVTVVTLNYRSAQNKIKEGIQYERVGLKKTPLNFASYFLAVRSIIHSHKFDLLIEDNIPPATFGLSPLYTKKPVIAQIQSFGAKFAAQKYKLPFERIEKWATKFYKNFITLTHYIEQKIVTLQPKAHIGVIPNGINQIYPLSSIEKNYLLFLGRISFFTKGLDYLLEIMEILQRKGINLELIIAGKGSDEAKLSHHIQQKNLKNIKYIGQIKGKAKEKLLDECLMLVQPSRHEVFPLTFLEAGAHGKPIVCFDVENIHEIMAEKIGLAVPAFDTQKYAKIILSLIDNKKMRKELGRNAHHWAQEHLWDELALRQNHFYLECLK